MFAVDFREFWEFPRFARGDVTMAKTDDECIPPSCLIWQFSDCESGYFSIGFLIFYEILTIYRCKRHILSRKYSFNSFWLAVGKSMFVKSTRCLNIRLFHCFTVCATCTAIKNTRLLFPLKWIWKYTAQLIILSQLAVISYHKILPKRAKQNYNFHFTRCASKIGIRCLCICPDSFVASRDIRLQGHGF